MTGVLSSVNQSERQDICIQRREVQVIRSFVNVNAGDVAIAVQVNQKTVRNLDSFRCLVGSELNVQAIGFWKVSEYHFG